MEIWKDIEGYIGLYQISNYGRLKSLARISKRGEIPERIMCTHTSKRGYKRAPLAKNGISKTYFIHTLVAVAFHTKSHPKHEVNHKDGDKLNNRSENLEWVSHKQNLKHASENDLLATGKNGKHYRAKKVQHKITGHIYTSIKEAAAAHNLNRSNLATYLRDSEKQIDFRLINT